MKFVFAHDKLVIKQSVDHGAIPEFLRNLNLNEFSSSYEDVVKYSALNGRHHHLLDLHKSQVDEESWQLVSLRELLFSLPDQDFASVAQAWQYAQFLKTHRYCGQCGSQMYRVHWEMATHCHKCQHRCYPRVSPCIIVAVRKDDKILLAQGAHHKTRDMHSTLAGFVESAESLEQAVHREVFEEVGIQIKNLRYFDSQPWPFPHSLMCGYLADYASGDIKVDEKEILNADWFDVDHLPNTPPTVSIAGRLIKATIELIKGEQIG
ncbi:NAD(+) diphosphatase [Glaciecola sp. 1036]|uniref:NAD(+) diphosphatase n=1 Tax=Alteromonadaceae TaxID=72275 RepID=UPI003D01387F